MFHMWPGPVAWPVGSTTTLLLSERRSKGWTPGMELQGRTRTILIMIDWYYIFVFLYYCCCQAVTCLIIHSSVLFKNIFGCGFPSNLLGSYLPGRSIVNWNQAFGTGDKAGTNWWQMWVLYSKTGKTKHESFSLINIIKMLNSMFQYRTGTSTSL